MDLISLANDKYIILYFTSYENISFKKSYCIILHSNPFFNTVPIIL